MYFECIQIIQSYCLERICCGLYVEDMFKYLIKLFGTWALDLFILFMWIPDGNIYSKYLNTDPK